jgi:hypothetical protein
MQGGMHVRELKAVLQLLRRVMAGESPRLAANSPCLQGIAQSIPSLAACAHACCKEFASACLICGHTHVLPCHGCH